MSFGQIIHYVNNARILVKPYSFLYKLVNFRIIVSSMNMAVDDNSFIIS
jgi:hypothetical protein